jgi:hypothetical protein
VTDDGAPEAPTDASTAAEDQSASDALTGAGESAAETPSLPRPPFAPDDAGHGLYVADLVGTVALALVCLVTAVTQSDAAEIATLVVSAVMFLGGCAAFAVGFVRAAGRSRYEVLDLAGLFYLTGSASPPNRRRFLGLWFAQIAIAAASVVAVRPPFGVMAPVWGIGLTTIWTSRHGSFPARPGVRRA